MTDYTNNKGNEILSIIRSGAPELNFADSSYLRKDEYHDYHKSYYEIYDDNLIYKGDRLDGKRHGIGRGYDVHNNLIYSGEWEDGVLNGWATKYSKYGKKIYSGEWKDSLPHGWGTEYREDGSVLYSGKWYNGKIAN